MEATPQPTKTQPPLDAMLTLEEAAAWLGVSQRWLAEDSRKHIPNVTVFRPSQGFIRYHPRTVLAVLAERAGVPPHIIAASFGMVRHDIRQV